MTPYRLVLEMFGATRARATRLRANYTLEDRIFSHWLWSFLRRLNVEKVAVRLTMGAVAGLDGDESVDFLGKLS